MKLFIIKGVLNDWTPGMVIIKSKDLESCREYFIQKFLPEDYDQGEDIDSTLLDYDYSVKTGNFIEMELSDTDSKQEGIITLVFGGG